MGKLLKNIFSYVLWFRKVPKDLSAWDKRDTKLLIPTTIRASTRIQDDPDSPVPQSLPSPCLLVLNLNGTGQAGVGERERVKGNIKSI
jgi:hypothetical protein